MISKGIVLIAVAAPWVTNARAQTAADADFAARCSGPGVVSCYGFDNTATDIVPNVNLYPNAGGTFRAGLDTTTKASGAGSLRFDLPPPPNAGANLAGSWVAGGWGHNFSENSTFYVQYRLRVSPYLVSANAYDGSSWKTSIFHSGTKTCAAISIVTSNYYGSPLAQMDTNCGGRGLWATLDGSQWTSSPPLLMQQTDSMQCQYGVNYLQNCEIFGANEWMTLYYKVQIGTWDQPNSAIDAWLGHERAPLKQFIKMRNYTLSCNAATCTSPTDRADGYNNVTLTPYMTGLSSTSGPTSTAYMWFDELIVSTQPIAAPNSPPIPKPPSGVQAK